MPAYICHTCYVCARKCMQCCTYALYVHACIHIDNKTLAFLIVYIVYIIQLFLILDGIDWAHFVLDIVVMYCPLSVQERGLK